MNKINFLSVFQENLYGETDRADRHTEEQTLFHRTLLAMSRGPRETTKSQLTIFQHCKIYLLEIGMILGGHDIADVRSL